MGLWVLLVQPTETYFTGGIIKRCLVGDIRFCEGSGAFGASLLSK